MKLQQVAVVLAMLLGTGHAAWQECTKTCSNIKNMRPCVKQSKSGCCVFNKKARKCVDWPQCKALKQKDCKKDPTCLWSWKGNTNSWAEDTNVQSRQGSCVDMPADFDKSQCQYNTQRGCQKLNYCKWRRNQNKQGGKCMLNGNPTASPTAPTKSPTKSPTKQPTRTPTTQPTVVPTPPYTGSYTANLGSLVTASGSTQRCGGSNQVTGQTLAQQSNCEAACNACGACVGYNWEVTSRNSAGVATYRCVYKNAATVSSSAAQNGFYAK